MAAAAPSTNPLADSLAKVTGIDPLSTTAGTATPIGYDPDLAFRAPEGDIISITGDPGTGATQSETWSHELSLEQMKQDQLEFEYAQQQDLLDQAQQQKDYELSLAASNLASQQAAAQESQFAQTYALQQAEEQRAAALAPYDITEKALANQAASYANMELARKEQDYQNLLMTQQANADQQRWLGGTAISPESSAAWKSAITSTSYKPGVSIYTPTSGSFDWYQKKNPYGSAYGW